MAGIKTMKQPGKSYGATLVAALRAYLASIGKRSLSAVTADTMEQLANETLAEWTKAQTPKADKLPPLKPMEAETRERLFTVLCELSGIREEELTNQKTKRDIGVALGEIRRSTGDVDEADVRRRAALYLKAWPGLKFTALGLAKHWASFPKPRPQVVVFEEWQAECPGWRQLLADAACRQPDSPLFCDDWRGLDNFAKRHAWSIYSKNKAVA